MKMTSTVDHTPTPSARKSSLAHTTDEELLLGYRASGNRELFDELVHRYEGELFNYLRRYLGNAEMAEDAFQASFLQVHLKCEQFEEGRKFRPWLYTIAINQAIDAQRRNRRHRVVSLDRPGAGQEADVGTLVDLLVSHEQGPATRAAGTERREWIRRAVGELPDYLRTAVQLVYYQGMKYREAAEVLAVPLGTVKSRLHAAVLKLHEAWDADHADQK
jgi:RNA polymerase sigma-70 factor (ECF subfamily)